MSNPLIDKYFELYPEKKEEPKKTEFLLLEDFKPKLAELRDTSTIPSVATSNTGLTKANNIPKLVSYDPHSAEGYFLEVAEKIKNKDARVTSVTLNQDRGGLFSTGMQTITFEVMLYDTP